MPNTRRRLRSAASRALFSLLFCSLFVRPAAGQEAVLHGTVEDAETGLTLPGANISITVASESDNGISDAAGIESRSYGVATDLDGRYSFTLPSGSYRMAVSFVGYVRFEEDMSLAAGESRLLTARLVSTDLPVNPITVTASRQPEKVLDAPAAITVIGPKQLESRTVLTAAQHLQTAPGLDIINTGLVTSRVVIRGFNDNLARSLLTLVDNRIARAPSVRLTALQLIPLTNGDTQQIEIVSGPASALYGPNAANGVVHIMTRSPFDSKGTRVSLAGGEQSVLLGSIRHANTYGRRIGYRFSLQYYTGSDFEFMDPVEMEARQDALSLGASPDTLRIGQRNFDVRNIGASGRIDFRLAENLLLVLTGGITQGDNIEITPTGAAQVLDARISYAQARLRYKDLFVQAYGNFLNSGASYFLRTGEVFKDKSSLTVVQVQHQARLGVRQRFTYGADLFHTVPQGEHTVTGRFEDRDEITEVGTYLQSETDLSTRLALVGAARLDYHNRLDAWTVSPRAAIVFKPRPEHSFRLTYNLAFKTPTAQELFADLLGQGDLFQLGQLSDVLGFAPITDLRVQGLISGFSFRSSPTGIPLYHSPFAPLAGRSDTDYIELGDPSVTGVMWDVARLATVEGLAANLAESGLLNPDDVASVSEAIDAVLPSDIPGVGNVLKQLDLDAQKFVDVQGPVDFSRLKVTSTRTIELGYKGVVKNFILLGVDLYHSNTKNFLGPFEVGTPNVFLDPSSLSSYLISSLETALDDPANSAAREALLPLDEIDFLGNSDGSAARELATLVSTGVAAAIPFGTVSPVEAFDPTAVILMRRNFGDLTIWGFDAHFSAFLSRYLQIGGTYSYVSDNYFENVDNLEDISLNAPRHKAGGTVLYRSPSERYGLQGGLRFVDGFRVKSDIYVGEVERFIVVDLAVNYSVPFLSDTQINLSIQNLTNNKHREFVFVPEIGRLTMLRLTHEF